MPNEGLQRDITIPHDEPLELYHNQFSLAATKVRVALAEKQLHYKGNHIHLVETGWYQTCSPAFKRISPDACVPILVHNGHPVYESHAQVEYINTTFPGPELRPAHLTDVINTWVNKHHQSRDMSQAAMEASMSQCEPALTFPLFASMLQDISYGKIFWGVQHHPAWFQPLFFVLLKFVGPHLVRIPPLCEMIQTGRNAMRKHLIELDEHLSDGRNYVAGDDFTLGDVGMVALFERLDATCFARVLYGDLPTIQEYWERLKARPSYKRAVHDDELPCQRTGTARLAVWKEQNPWFQEALDTSSKPSLCPPQLMLPLFVFAAFMMIYVLVR